MNSSVNLPARAFSDVARGFCGWCESQLGPDPESRGASWLCRLYAAALDLPPVKPENERGLPDIREQRLRLAEKHLSYFNGHYCREYFNPDPMLNEESVMGDIGDDLLDTYKDVCRGLLLFAQGAQGEAQWHWSFLHEVHWGRHAVGALMALHCLSRRSRSSNAL